MYLDNSNKLSVHSILSVESTLTDIHGQYFLCSISPDGNTIAFCSEKGIQIRSLSEFSVIVLEGTENTNQLGFSPDGQSLIFVKQGNIYKIGTDGSSLSLVYSKGIIGPGIFWGIDGYIYFSPGLGSEGIWRVSANGGESEQVTYVIDSLIESAHSYPQLLPDSKTLLFTSLGPSGGSIDSKIIIQNLITGERKILINNAIFGRYLSNRTILFATNDGNISIIPFILRKLEIEDEPRSILSNVHTATWGGGAFLSVSENGNLIFVPRIKTTATIIDVVDRQGKPINIDSIPLSTLEKTGYSFSVIKLSPLGDILAFNGRSFGSTDIWLLNLKTGGTEKITFDTSEDEYPVWSPDGNLIAYASAMTGTTRRLFLKNLKSAGNPQLICTWPRHLHFTSWSPSGKWLAAYDYTSTYGTDCYVLSADSGEAISIAKSQANESNGQFSPDGRWVAFQSDESRRSEIYIISFPEIESKRQISIEGGFLPRWDRNGEFIYFISNNYMIAQPIDLENGFKKGPSINLFYIDALDFDISPDGKKFYLVRKNLNITNSSLFLITNWFQDLKAKTAN